MISGKIDWIYSKNISWYLVKMQLQLINLLSKLGINSKSWNMKNMDQKIEAKLWLAWFNQDCNYLIIKCKSMQLIEHHLKL